MTTANTVKGDRDGVIARVANLCRDAREILGSQGSQRLHIALEIVEVECALELQRLSAAETKASDQP